MTIRFRLVEDERRYLALRAELYMRLSHSGATAAVLADVLRNLGKIESFAYAEGIRQGAVAVELTNSCEDRSALVRHHEAYGSADTPLREVEKNKWNSRGTHGVFEEQPLEFAPLTLAEAKVHYAAEAATAPPPPTESATRQRTAISEILGSETEAEQNSADVPELSQETHAALLDDEDNLFAEPVRGRRPEGDPQADEHLYEVSSPDLLDRVRDELKVAQDSGVPFPTWEDLIFFLHRTLGVDAGALDLQLSTHEGRAVLDQAGFFDFPPPVFDMARFIEAAVPLPTPPEQ